MAPFFFGTLCWYIVMICISIHVASPLSDIVCIVCFHSSDRKLSIGSWGSSTRVAFPMASVLPTDGLICRPTQVAVQAPALAVAWRRNSNHSVNGKIFQLEGEIIQTKINNNMSFVVQLSTFFTVAKKYNCKKHKKLISGLRSPHMESDKTFD